MLEFGKFDMVCGNGILHHLVRQLPRVLGNLHRMTNPGGGLAFIEPNFLNPYCAFAFGTKIGRRMARLEPDEMAFRPAQLRQRLAEAGWRDVEVKMRDFLVPGLPLPLVKPVLAVEPAAGSHAADQLACPVALHDREGLSPMKRISIISPAYNEEDNVEACYQAVAALFAPGAPLEGYEREHIFADNASEDRTAEFCAGLPPRTHASR